MSDELKAEIEQYWNERPCGDVYATGEGMRGRLQSQAAVRYSLEPYIERFARFHEAAGEDVLEIGVGMGADHARFASVQPRYLAGVDLTPRAVEWTRARLTAYGLSSDLRIADAEKLPFADDTFSLVYSWGVLHHTPDTQRAIREVSRVLKPGGSARVMVYNRRSITGYLLWLRYGLLTGRPLRRLDDIYYHHLESEGTKAYSPEEVRTFFSDFDCVRVQTEVSFADMLKGAAAERCGRWPLNILRLVWPRRFIARYMPRYGLYLLIEASG